MQVTIDFHDATPVLLENVFGHNVLIETTGFLQQDNNTKKFQFLFHNEVTVDGKKKKPNDIPLEVSGDIPETSEDSPQIPGLTTFHSVSEFNVNAGIVSCKLSLRSERAGKKHPMFTAQVFSGKVVAVQFEELRALLQGGREASRK